MPLLDDLLTAPATSEGLNSADAPDVRCECMLCDLPCGQDHGPVLWRMTLDFPGPYPAPGREDMLLCEHCKNSWLADDWPEPYDNFTVVRCVRV